MLESVKTLYEHHKDRRTHPSFEEISKVLFSVVADCSRSFIIIDALDDAYFPIEAVRSYYRRSSPFSLRLEQTSLRLSRFIPEIEKEFKGSILLKIRASAEYIQRYLDDRMLLLPPFVVRSLELQKEIKTEIVKAVDGM